MILYKGTDIHSGKPVAGWYVHADNHSTEAHIIIEDLTEFDGDSTFWYMNVHEIDPITLVAVNDRIVFCKDCMSGRKKLFPGNCDAEYTPTPERLDPSFLIQFVRQNSCFDADLLEKIIEEWKQFKKIGTCGECEYWEE